MIRPILGVVFVAAVATFGDYLWFAIGLRDEATAGSAHGAPGILSIAFGGRTPAHNSRGTR